MQSRVPPVPVLARAADKVDTDKVDTDKVDTDKVDTDKVDTDYEVVLSLCGTVTGLHPTTTMNSDKR